MVSNPNQTQLNGKGWFYSKNKSHWWEAGFWILTEALTARTATTVREYYQYLQQRQRSKHTGQVPRVLRNPDYKLRSGFEGETKHRK